MGAGQPVLGQKEGPERWPTKIVPPAAAEVTSAHPPAASLLVPGSPGDARPCVCRAGQWHVACLVPRCCVHDPSAGFAFI